MEDLIINLEDDFVVSIPGQPGQEVVLNYSDEIVVRARESHLVSVELTQQGPQGPQGEKGDKGDLTPELIAARDEAVAAATSAGDAKMAAETAQSGAVAAKNAAVTAQGAAETAKADAVSAKNAAANSAGAAATSASNADTRATAAANSATAAHTSETNAAASAQAAADSQADALASKNAANTAKNAANTAKSAAETAQSGAIAAKEAAEAAQTGAVAAKDDLVAAKEAAEASATAAAASEQSASDSAGAASTSASNAATSATNADASAQAADASQADALVSKNAASASETAAAGSASDAAGSAAAAAASAGSVGNAEANSAASAAAAADARTAAEAAAGASQSNAEAAATSESAAASSATTAADSAALASNAKTAAEASATAAAGSASDAETSATAAATSEQGAVDAKIDAEAARDIAQGYVDDLNNVTAAGIVNAVNAKAEKATPAVADRLPIIDTASGNVLAWVSVQHLSDKFAGILDLNAKFALKADKTDAALTGVPTAPTAALGTNTDQIATMAALQAAIAALQGSAPETLDTLGELAARLEDDEDAVTALTTLIGTKLNAASYTAADVLAKLLTVDADDAGINATTLGGHAVAYFAKASGGTITGDLLISKTVPLFTLRDTNAAGSGAQGYINWQDSAGAQLGYVGQVSANNSDLYVGSKSGYVHLNGTYDSDLTTLLVGNSKATLDGFEMWHAGNDAPLAKLTGAQTFTGNIYVAKATPTLTLQDTGASGAGVYAYIQWLGADGARTGYVGDGSGQDAVELTSENGASRLIGTRLTDSTILAVSNSVATLDGFEMWHAGNDGPLAKLAGATFTGEVRTPGRIRTRHIDGMDAATFEYDNLYLNYTSNKPVYIGSGANQGIVWHSANDGPGSLLDAGMLEGHRAAEFVARDESDSMRIIRNPKGGTRRSSVSTETGAIKITLPVGWTAAMFSFRVLIYDYSGVAYEFIIGGYNYSTSSAWYNTTAFYWSDNRNANNLSVRFGIDDGNPCVWIGETNTSWNYPQVAVTDVHLGYSGASSGDWSQGWSVDIDTAFGTVQSTLSNIRVGAPVDLSGLAPKVSPALSGTPTAPTPSAATNNTQIATTAHVHAAITSDTADLAPKASPAFTGTPTAPTQAVGNNSTRLATTAFVRGEIAALVGAAPSTLDTLAEIADRLASDEDTAAALATQMGTLAPKATPTFTGNATFSGDITVTGDKIDVRRGLSGSYGNLASSGSAWGANIWGMGPSYDGSSYGTGYGISGHYGISWLRGSHASALSAAAEGLYITAAGVIKGAVGSAGIWSAGNISAYSDRRVKENLQPIENALGRLLKLTGYTYDRIDTGAHQLGVVAQEVMEVFPELVTGDETAYSVAYGNFAGVFIEAFKEANATIERQAERITQLENLLVEMDRRLIMLEIAA